MHLPHSLQYVTLHRKPCFDMVLITHEQRKQDRKYGPKRLHDNIIENRDGSTKAFQTEVKDGGRV